MTTKIIQTYFVSSGILDVKMKFCPDIHGIIQSFKENWSEVEGGMDEFHKKYQKPFLNSTNIAKS